ncbi:hypothetical protein [Jeotgalibacillus proteolyticus]|uniref:AP2 domain-containing protein n=1 Tax=Jeotgalibacillus proteolyticus TaxID=2082395 RepID=A0A2S5GAM9_9BACL|nr:hypothetical protein [Jeotgalibacillus proteolyticus]PPA70072.1 hypothetical protein C4B60_10805 [Jeotgalibacillus proteolyticus]
MPQRIDRTGMRFGRLIVRRLVEVNKYHQAKWECICDCGNVTIVHYSNLHTGTSKSCGCLKSELNIKRNTKHGLSGRYDKDRRIYVIWIHMRSRCLNESDIDYAHYGGRGIKICEEWSDYAVFYKWAKEKGYNQELTIERIDNDGNYEPTNCRWATRKEQARNRRSNPQFTFNGKTKTIPDWAEEMNISYSALRTRLHDGWSIEKALTTPIKNNRNEVI